MKRSANMLVIVTGMLILLASTAIVSTRETLPAARIRAINQRLQEAGVPLTERQINYLKGLEDTTGFKRRLFSILTEEQLAALGMETKEGRDNEIDGDATKPTDVDEQPGAFNALHQNYPNHFNPVTTISYDLAAPGNVTVEVLDNNGRLVDRIVYEYQRSGRQSVVWDASDRAAGIYLYRITAKGFTDIGRMSFIK